MEGGEAVELNLLSAKHTFSVRAGLPQYPIRQPLLSVVEPRPEQGHGGCRHLSELPTH